MASFTGVGDTLSLFVPVKGSNIDVAISGTYNMVIKLQRELGSRGSGGWETLKTWDTANATVAYVHTTSNHNENIRLIVDVDTSGTATVTLTDNDNRVVHTFKDEAGNTLAQFDEWGMTLNGAIRRTNAVEPVTVATTLTAAEHAGRPIVFNDADGATVTLPAATGTGNVYEFFVGVTITSVSHKIQVANATDEFVGNLMQIDTDTADAIAAYPALDADGFDTVTLDGTDGGLQGCHVRIVDIAAGKFHISGTILGTGTVGTPFTAAVS